VMQISNVSSHPLFFFSFFPFPYVYSFALFFLFSLSFFSRSVKAFTITKRWKKNSPPLCIWLEVHLYRNLYTCYSRKYCSNYYRD
jgi:hypothetical protein